MELDETGALHLIHQHLTFKTLNVSSMNRNKLFEYRKDQYAGLKIKYCAYGLGQEFRKFPRYQGTMYLFNLAHKIVA